MLHLRVFGHADPLTAIGSDLEGHGTARNVALTPGVRPDHVLLTAEVFAESADAVLELLVRSGVAEEDIKLARLDEIGPMKPGRAAASLIWADVLGQARENARPVARYLVFLIAAGVIAGFGVLGANTILIVGAMAVSPDLLPITAACVGLASGRGRLVLRAPRSPRFRPRPISAWRPASARRRRRWVRWPSSESTWPCWSQPGP